MEGICDKCKSLNISIILFLFIFLS